VVRSTRVVRSSATLWRSGPFGQVLLAPGDAEPHALTGTAAVLWDALVEPVTADDLAADLAVAFGTDPATVAADIAPLLAAWLASGAVVEA
jgi:hypothetical protein